MKDTVESFDLKKPEEPPEALLIEGEDELAILSRAFSAMQKRLVETVRSLKQNQLELRHLNENLEDVLDNFANLVTVKAQEKEDLEVLIATAQEIPRSLVGDPLRLGQILINLANNAVKFTDSGEIVVSTEVAEQNEDRITLKFSVSDTGIGLTKEQAAQHEEQFPDSLPGFDLGSGLKRLRGNKRLYRKLLLDFGVNYGGVAGEIREALAARDFKQAHSLVHNLKGLAGNLAATDIHSSAMELEKLIKNSNQKHMPSPEVLEQKVFTLEQALNQALGSVQTLDVAAQGEPAKLDLDAMAALPTQLSQDTARRLRNAVELGDVMQLVAIAETLKSQSDDYVPLSNNIIRLAQDFDFGSIIKLASALGE